MLKGGRRKVDTVESRSMVALDGDRINAAFLESYSPDWTSKNLVLTPSLYVIGTTTDQITSSAVTSVKWYIGSSTTAITSSGSYALSGAKSHILTVKGNVMGGPARYRLPLCRHL